MYVFNEVLKGVYDHPNRPLNIWLQQGWLAQMDIILRCAYVSLLIVFNTQFCLRCIGTDGDVQALFNNNYCHFKLVL